jgi:hypothetical protein
MNPSNPSLAAVTGSARPFSSFRSRVGRSLCLVPFLAYAACAVPMTESQPHDTFEPPGDEDLFSGGKEPAPDPPFPGSGTSFGYQGGNVMSQPTKIFYIWYGAWAPGNSTVTILEDLAKNLGGSPYFNINTGYSDNTGARVKNTVTFGGSIFVGHFFGSSLSSEDIEDVVQEEVDVGAVPKDPNAVYFVITSSDVANEGMCTSWCGWHLSGTINGSDLKYSFIGSPDVCPTSCGWDNHSLTGPNGNQEADGMASIIAHELSESVYDPDFDAWHNSTTPTEGGDVCSLDAGHTYTAGTGTANVHLGSRDFLIQQEWVNTPFGGCDQHLMLTKPMSGLGGKTTGDFNADTGADILWRNAATHEVSIWTMLSSTVLSTASLGIIDPGWQIYGVADFTNDSRADILWYNQTTQATSIWIMSGATRVAILNPGGPPVPLLFPGAQIQGTADLNADGRADILWRQPGNSGLIAQLTTGGVPTTVTFGSTMPAQWQVVGTGDFNGDHHADILWQDNVTHSFLIWYLNGTTVTSSPMVRFGAGDPIGDPITVLGLADFNHDGRADILWSGAGSATVNVFPGQLDGSLGAAFAIGTKPGGEWRVESAADFTGDSNADVLWRNRRDGQVRLWVVSGASHTDVTVSGGVSLPWEIVRN